jgi:hypothetical protein
MVFHTTIFIELVFLWSIYYSLHILTVAIVDFLEIHLTIHLIENIFIKIIYHVIIYFITKKIKI